MRKVVLEALCLDTLRDVTVTLVLHDHAPQVPVTGEVHSMTLLDENGFPRPSLARVRSVEYIEELP